MARGFKRKGRRGQPTTRYAARLDQVERGLVVGLMEQVLLVIDPLGDTATLDAGRRSAEARRPADGGRSADGTDEFDRIVAGLGGIGQGVSVVDDAPHTAAELDSDPALRRLFPTANRVDEQAAGEFRRLTEQSLRSRKVLGLQTAIEALQRADDKVELTAPEALALVVALTDVRLVLADRLGLETEEDSARLEQAVHEADPDDPMVYAAAVYSFLAWLQETLSDALMP